MLSGVLKENPRTSLVHRGYACKAAAGSMQGAGFGGWGRLEEVCCVVHPLCGVLRCAQEDASLRRAYLSNVCVATAARRQGAAAALMTAAEDLARGLGEQGCAQGTWDLLRGERQYVRQCV